MNNDIISDSSLDGYPGNEALYNYLPVAIAKGMATNQIAADGDILTQLPDIIGETQYNEFKKELEHIQAEYPNQIEYTINDNGIVTGITPYYGIYNTIYNPGTTAITDLDLKYKDKINMYHVLMVEKNDLLQLLLPTVYQVKILRANIYYLKIYEMMIVKSLI